MCKCGAPAFYKKTGECKRCYHRRYNAAYHARVVKPREQAAREAREAQRVEALAVVPDAAVDEAVVSLAMAVKEHRRAVAAARATLVRERDRELVLIRKAAYRRRNRDQIRVTDAEYRSRPHVAARRRDQELRRELTPEQLERRRAYDQERRQDPVRQEKQRRYARESAARRRAKGKR